MSGFVIPAPSLGTITNMTGTADTMLYVDNTGAVQEVALGTSGQVLRSNGAGAAPSFVDADFDTGSLSGTPNSVLYINGSGAVINLALGTNGQVLTSTGTTSAPQFQTSVGGSNNVEDLIGTANSVLYVDAVGDVTPLALAADGLVLTSTGVNTAPEFRTVSISSGDINAAPNTMLYSDNSGDIVDFSLGASGTVVTSTGATTAPAFAAIPDTDINNLVGLTNNVMYFVDNGGTLQALSHGTNGQTLTSNGATSAPTWESGSASGIITDLTGTANSAIYVDNLGNVEEVALGAAGTVLTSLGATTAPTFSAVGVTVSNISGNPNRVLYLDNSGDMQEVALGTSGQVLTSNGIASAPSFQAGGSGGGGVGSGINIGLTLALT